MIARVAVDTTEKLVRDSLLVRAESVANTPRRRDRNPPIRPNPAIPHQKLGARKPWYPEDPCAPRYQIEEETIIAPEPHPRTRTRIQDRREARSGSSWGRAQGSKGGRKMPARMTASIADAVNSSLRITDRV